MRAIQITQFGGPEVLELVDIAPPPVPDGFVGIAVSSAGVNYADTHQAEDSYLAKQELPLVPGAEVVGQTDDGRRVVALVSGGGYAERAVAHPAMCFELPPAVDDGAALSLVLQGLTAWHLLRTSTHLAAGESVVVHAAAGGVGTIAVQLAKLWGAGRVIATASNAEKRALAAELGADATVDPAEPDLRAALRDANGGKAVDVVLEMTGGAVFDASLAALAPFGRMATFGMASRTAPQPIDAGSLMSKSRTVAGFWLAHCFGRPEMLAAPMTELLSLVTAGRLTPVLGGTYPLSEARQAHVDIRSRRTVGKLILDPAR